MKTLRSLLLDEQLRPLVRATVLSAVFLMLAWLLERPALALPSLVPVLLYAVSYVAGGYLRVRDGMAALREGRLSIDMLMVLGAAGAAALGRWHEGAILIFLFALSHTLEEFAAGRTRKAIESLMTLRPDEARVRLPDGSETAVPVDQVAVGQLVVVRPGELFPVDGQVVEGRTSADQSLLTGESIPVEKEPGAPVFAGTLNGTGLVVMRVERAATESTLSRIIALVEEAQERKASSQRFVDWIDRYYTLLVVVIASIAFVVPPLALSWMWADSFYLAMQLLVVLSPCALVIATPAALLSAVAAGARRGILFKGGVHLEEAGQIQVVAFDKTGTLTEGKPRVHTIVPVSGVSEAEILRVAAAVEAHSGHPLAQAITLEATARQITYPQPDEVTERPGYGIAARVEGQEVRVGSRRLLTDGSSPWLAAQLDELGQLGQTCIMVEREGALLGVIGVADTIRPEAAAAVQALRAIGIKKLIMLTGDNERVAAAVCARIGLDEFRASLLPEDKLAAIREIQERYGPVAMVGDGANDAPALATATLGVAMGGAGNDAALESADVVLMSDDLRNLAEAFRLGRRSRVVVAQNLVLAGGVILLLAVLTLTNQLNLPMAVVGHEGSTILVAINGLRLLLRGRPRPDGALSGAAPKPSRQPL